MSIYYQENVFAWLGGTYLNEDFSLYCAAL